MSDREEILKLCAATERRVLELLWRFTTTRIWRITRHSLLVLGEQYQQETIALNKSLQYPTGIESSEVSFPQLLKVIFTDWYQFNISFLERRSTPLATERRFAVSPLNIWGMTWEGSNPQQFAYWDKPQDTPDAEPITLNRENVAILIPWDDTDFTEASSAIAPAFLVRAILEHLYSPEDKPLPPNLNDQMQNLVDNVKGLNFIRFLSTNLAVDYLSAFILDVLAIFWGGLASEIYLRYLKIPTELSPSAQIVVAGLASASAKCINNEIIDPYTSIAHEFIWLPTGAGVDGEVVPLYAQS